MLRNHQFSQRNKTTKRAVGVEAPSMAPSPTHITSLIDYPYNLTKYERENSKISILQLFSEFGGIWKYSPANN